MNICCLIDSLNSGGAQRQMTWLIRALVKKGNQVRLLTYHDYSHFRQTVVDSGVEPEVYDGSSKVGRFWEFRKLIRKDRPDVIISFLDTPNYIGLFAGAQPRKIPVIVSERNHDIGGKTISNRIRFHAFRLATKVVTNCFSQNEFIQENYPFLKSKLSTILNCVDLERFHPTDSTIKPKGIIVAASVVARKNAQNLIRGFEISGVAKSGFSVDWYGNRAFHEGQPTPQSQYYLDSMSLIEELNLQESFRFHDPLVDIAPEYPKHSACCLPSLREGCPNTICEAMASGLPSLVSNHGDMQRMIDSSRGFSFNPRDPESISEALIKFSKVSSSEWQEMSMNNRKYAEEFLGPARFANEYQSLIEGVVQ